MASRRRTISWVLLIVVLALAAVWIYPVLRFPGRMEAVPADKTGRAEVAGLPGVRYRVAEELTPFVNDVLAARVREKEFLARSGKSDELPPMDLLAISGGGDKGAFGAGLLCGWTEAGDRPTFKGVTGVSTGALIAPFAFLGPEYDHVLRTVYTGVSQKDIALARNFLAAITDDGMADNRPLWTLISKYVNEGFLARIAEEDAKGRLLLIGTTDLDSREPVIWNMGKIAAAPDHKKALELFRNILVASAAIPGAFPPTMIEVEVDGKKYEEMHVDGGASAQVFLYPPSMSQLAKSMEVTMRRPGRVFIIRNSLFRSDWARVERRTLSIANRAISSLIHTQGIGDLYRIYSTTQLDGLEFNLAYVDDGFQAEHTVEFDPVFMKKLFGYGFELARKGYPWKHAPPGMTAALNR